MKANELRIGNYIHDRSDRLCKVETISTNLINSVFGEEFKAPAIVGGLTSLPHKPIQLTEEWLIRFGFIPTESNFFGKINYWNKEKDCSIDVETVCVGTKVEKIFRYRICSDARTKCIIYVHSLQNLYFALTGEELTLNP
jgi:hypothetical protein